MKKTISDDFLKTQEKRTVEGQEKASKMLDIQLKRDCEVIQDYLLSILYPNKYSLTEKDKLQKNVTKLGYKLTTDFNQWFKNKLKKANI